MSDNWKKNYYSMKRNDKFKRRMLEDWEENSEDYLEDVFGKEEHDKNKIFKRKFKKTKWR